jgi:GT2 family glycosyltransferase
MPKSAFAIVLDGRGLRSGPRALTVDAVARGGASTRRSGKLLIDPVERYRRRFANQRGQRADSPEGRPADSVELRVCVTEGEPGAALRDALDAQDQPPAVVTNVGEGLDEALGSLLESSHRAAVFAAAGDWLDARALATIAARFEGPTPPDLVYSDHDSRGANGLRSDPFHKPGWSPELLLSLPYVGSFVAVGPRAAEAALRSSGGRLDSVHALLLALVDEPLRVERIPEVLWSRQARDFYEVSEHEDAALAQVAAGRGARISVTRRDQRAGVRDVEWALEGGPAVSVVIPTTGREMPLSACLRSLMDRTAYPDLEVVLVDGGGEAGAAAESVGLAHRVVPYEAAEFNFSRACNLGAGEARGEYIAFVNDDVEALDGEWLARMVAQAQLPATGAVGAKLLYPNGLVQHAGLVLDRLSASAGFDFVAAQFAFHQESEDPRHLMNLPRDCSAVTGACLLMPADVLGELGGWDERFRIDFGDIDLCLRAIEAGRRVVVEPRARLLHHVHATQGQNPHDEDDGRRFRDRWSAAYADGDPWYHPACTFGRDWEVR